MFLTPHIRCVETLGYSNDDVAQSYMKYIIERIALILPRRGWHIGILKEFYPSKSSLLGLNIQQGVEICIRLRVPGNKQTFLPFHEVVCTALHELAHCQEKKHNMLFWNLYYELLRECEVIEAKMLMQGRVLYPEHILSSVENTITKRVGNKFQKRGKKGSEKGKLESTQHSTTTPNFSLLLDNSSKTEGFFGVGHRLGGLQLPNGSKPNSDFLATIIENRLQGQDTHFIRPENAEVRFDLGSPPETKPIDIYTSWSSQYMLCGSWSQDNIENSEACADDRIISVDKYEDPLDIHEGQEMHILKHRKLEQVEDHTAYLAKRVPDDDVGLRASCPITID
ncbi:unnamed protein product [Phytomonas sp. Hart1]|nr:unnamed protein product [Phytomonas sp. Hart1]|eukprot:CCW66965.1 unnamed protein product [Phytomonas sp. isolate Hart1]